MKLLLPITLCLLAFEPLRSADIPVAKLSKGDITRFITIPGEVRAYQQAMIYAKVGGYLRTVKADIGDSVAAGQILAEIEVPELEAELVKFEAESAALKPAYEFAQQEYDRMVKAQKSSPDLVLPQMLEKAKSEMDKAKAAFDVVEANAKRARVMLGFSKVSAPFAGVILRRWLDAGAFAPAATNSTAAKSSALFEIADLGKARLQASVPEYESGFVANGQPVKFTCEALAGQTFEGQVTRFSPALDPITKTMLIEAEVANDKQTLRPGMYAMVKVGIETHKGASIMPVAGLVMEKLTAVAFLHKDGKARRIVIKIGFNDGKNVEVLEGLAPEDDILLVGTAAMTDGQAVTATTSK